MSETATSLPARPCWPCWAGSTRQRHIYLPDEARSKPLPRRGVATALPRQPLRERDPWTGRVSGILGITMFVMLLMLYPLLIVLSGEFNGSGAAVMVVWFGVALVTFVGSIIGLVVAVHRCSYAYCTLHRARTETFT